MTRVNPSNGPTGAGAVGGDNPVHGAMDGFQFPKEMSPQATTKTIGEKSAQLSKNCGPEVQEQVRAIKQAMEQGPGQLLEHIAKNQ